MAVLAIADRSTSSGLLICPYLSSWLRPRPDIWVSQWSARPRSAPQPRSPARGELNVAAVFIISVIGNEIGGGAGEWADER